MSKTILVTGASSGIGFHLANDLHKKGFTVIGLSRKQPNDIEYDYIECDLTNSSAIDNAVETLTQKYPVIDVLVNCAGVGTGGALQEVSEQDTKWVFDVNVFGVMELTRKVLPLIKESTQGKIINIGSVAGEITIPYQVSYSMSKSSITRFSEGLRLELREFNIQVSTVLPGDTKTGFTNNRKTINPEASPYHTAVERSIKKMEKDEQNGVSPMKVVRIIERFINKRRMPLKRIVGFDYQLLVFLKAILPNRLVEFVVLKLYG